MPWNHHHEVHVTSRAELEAALRSADRIVVEGDASLADYVRRLAGGDAAAAAPEAPRLRPLAALEREAHVSTSSRPPRLWPWIAGALGLAAAAGAALLLEHFARPAALPKVQAAPHLDPTTLAWPSFAVAVILALYLLARHTTPSSRNAWRITEKAGSRVVITKVRAA